MLNTMNSQVLLYQAEDGSLKTEVPIQSDTVWLTQKQMAELFNKDVRTINEHVQNIYTENELTSDSTIRKFRIVREEGQRKVNRNIEHYFGYNRHSRLEHMNMKGTPKALAVWERIPPHFCVKLLNNAYCTHCRGVTSIADSSVGMVDKCILIKGICVTCHGPVARLVEND